MSSASNKMETEKMEIDTKFVTVKKETDLDQKMDVATEGIKQEPLEESVGGEDNISADIGRNDIKKNDDIEIQIIPKEPGQAYLTVDRMVVEEDESITMTAEEVRSYIEKAVFDQIVNNNPLIPACKQITDTIAEGIEKKDEFMKLARLIDMIERDQMKFLRTDKFLRKFLTKTGGVGVELPVLQNSMPNDALLKRGFISQAPNATSNKPAPVPSKTVAPTTAPVFATKSAPGATKVTAGASADSPAADKTQKAGADIECIDLTDESEIANEAAKKSSTSSSFSYLGLVTHPAPLPPKPFSLPNKNLPPIPPKPRLKISSEERGIVLQWDMIPNTPENKTYATLQAFDIFGYQEQKNIPINTLLWKKIGSVKAMTLPMACTLTQFIEGNKYHFSIRAVDVHNRCGFYSDPISIVYNQTKS